MRACATRALLSSPLGGAELTKSWPNITIGARLLKASNAMNMLDGLLAYPGVALRKIPRHELRGISPSSCPLHGFAVGGKKNVTLRAVEFLAR
jgi:hypothetical protein